MLKSVFIVGLSRCVCFAFEDNYVKTNGDMTKMFNWNSSFRQYKIYSGMCYGLCARRCQLTVGAILVDSHASVAM